MQGSEQDGVAIETILRDFALAVREAQGVARRLGFLATSVEESVEDVVDFHAAVETLVSAAPVTEAARAMRDRLSDEDRRLLRETRAARNELVYDFFIDHPLDLKDGATDRRLAARAHKRLGALSAVLMRAQALTDRLEADLAETDDASAP